MTLIIRWRVGIEGWLVIDGGSAQEGFAVQFSWNRIEAFPLLPHAGTGNFHFEIEALTAGWSICSRDSLTKVMFRTTPSSPTSNVASTNPSTLSSLRMTTQEEES